MKSTNKHFRNNKGIVQSIWCNSTGFHRNPRNTKTRNEREIERGFTNQSGEGARFKLLSRNLDFWAKWSPGGLSLTLSHSLVLSLFGGNRERRKRWGAGKKKEKRKGREENDMRGR